MATRYSSLEAVFAVASSSDLVWAQESPSTGDYVWLICQYFNLEDLWKGRPGYQVLVPDRSCRLFLNIVLPGEGEELFRRLRGCMADYLRQHGGTENEVEVHFWRVANTISIVWKCHFTNNAYLASFMARFKQMYSTQDFAALIDLRQYHDWEKFPVVDPCIEKDIHAAYGPRLHVEPYLQDPQISWLHEPARFNPRFRKEAITPTHVLTVLNRGNMEAGNAPIGSIVNCPKGADCNRFQAAVYLLKTGKVVACRACSIQYYIQDYTIQKGFAALPHELVQRLHPDHLRGNSKITVIDAPMGYGKTTVCKLFLQQDVPNNARVLALCFRKGLCSFLAISFNLNDYQLDNFWSHPSHANRAVVCLNSLYKMATVEYNKHYDCIVIDECVFCMVHMLSGTFDDRFNEVMAVLTRLLRNATKVSSICHSQKYNGF
jgi:hypothetical protein